MKTARADGSESEKKIDIYINPRAWDRLHQSVLFFSFFLSSGIVKYKINEKTRRDMDLGVLNFAAEQLGGRLSSEN